VTVPDSGLVAEVSWLSLVETISMGEGEFYLDVIAELWPYHKA
jgi:hypothetical protein